MRLRRLVAVGVVAAPVVALLRKRREAQRERVVLFYEDGSSITFEAGSDAGERLLALARPAVRP
jgi:hypothetical protein